MKLTYLLICLIFTINCTTSNPFLSEISLENLTKSEGLDLNIDKIITHEISAIINLETNDQLGKSCNIRYEGDKIWIKNMNFSLQNNEFHINQNSFPNSTYKIPKFFINCNSKVFYDLNSSGNLLLKIKNIKNDIFISGAGYLSLDLNYLKGNLDITFQGNIDANIDEIYGNVNIDSTGYNKFLLKKGKIDTLILELEGHSKFKADTKIQDAETALIGSGFIELNDVSGEVNRLENIGNGKIKYRKSN